MTQRDREGWKEDSSVQEFIPRQIKSSQGFHGNAQAPRVSRGTDIHNGGVNAIGAEPLVGRPTQFAAATYELYGILVVLTGARRFDIHKITQRKATIGRGSCDIILDDPAVSHQHAVLVVSGNNSYDAQFSILDRDADGTPTRNGIRINGEFRSAHLLKDRDHILLGDTEMMFVQLWPFLGGEA